MSLYNCMAYLPLRRGPADCGGVWVLVRSLPEPPAGLLQGRLTVRFGGGGGRTDLHLHLTGALRPGPIYRMWLLGLPGGQTVTLPMYPLPLPAEVIHRLRAHRNSLEPLRERPEAFTLREDTGPDEPVQEIMLILTWEAL